MNDMASHQRTFVTEKGLEAPTGGVKIAINDWPLTGQVYCSRTFEGLLAL